MDEENTLCTWVYPGSLPWELSTTSEYCPTSQACAAPMEPGDYLYEERTTPCE